MNKGLIFPNSFFLRIIKLRILILIILLSFNKVLTQDFESITPNILDEQATLLEVENNEDSKYIITTKHLFSGINPENIINFEDELPSNVEFAYYDSDYILAVCTNNNLLSFFNLNSVYPSEEKAISSYASFSLSKTSNICSLSFISPNAYVVHTVVSGGSIKLYLIKIKLGTQTAGPALSFSPYFFQTSISLYSPEDFSYISCKAIIALNDNTDSVLVCSYLNFNSATNIYSYLITTVDFSHKSINEPITIFESENLLYFKLYRINSTYIRYLVGTNSFEISLTKESSNYVINIASEELRNQYLYSFYSYNNLFYYNNEYIFQATLNDETNLKYYLYISNSAINNKLITFANNKQLIKLSGLYDKENDKFIYIYQYSNTIEYFILEYKCFSNAWYNDTDNSIICYTAQNYCNSNQYYYHTETRECVLSDCRNGYFQFNFECYKNNCPENTLQISPNENKCESTLDFCYIDTNYKTHCDSSLNSGYTLQYEKTKIFFNDCGDSAYFFNIQTHWYKNTCLEECPIQTTLNEENNKCKCNYYIYYTNSERSVYECLKENEICSDFNRYSITDKNECVGTKQECIDQGYKIFNYLCLTSCPINTKTVGDDCKCEFNYYKNNEGLNCFAEEKSCEDIGYPIKSDTNECFLSKDDCIEKGNKYFNKLCYTTSCPENTYEKDNNGICYCSNFYYYDTETDLYICLAENETCESRGYSYKNDILKQCFNYLDDCKEKSLKIFNNECYVSCPGNTVMSENDNSICVCNNYFFYNEEQNLYDCFDSDKLCITANHEYQYTNIETKECFKTKEDCLQKSDKEKCRYFDSCDPSKDYMFNNICYKSNCPQGTILDPLNPSSRNCICKEDFEIDPITGLITCVVTYPEEYYTNKDQCPYIYNGVCVPKCPENTCLNPNLKELINCVDIMGNIKVYNGICIEGIEEMIANIVDSDNFTNIKTIQTSSGTTINTYPTGVTKDIFEKNYPNLTYVDLGDCKDKLKIHYNLENETKLYILGIDSPNLYGNSSINVFNFEIYLKNGTQLKDLSACNEVKIITSSYINNLNLIKFETAKTFSNDGYDIYNKTDKFYTDNCAPANDNGNDITLEDRKTYYYPNISICNEGCDYNSIDFESQRFVCECNINLTSVNDTNIENEENKEENESYLEYFLSLINYKIIKCFHLVNEYKNYYYNAGIYIGLATLIISISLIFVFCIKTMDTIKNEFLKNMPTKEKLEQIYRTNMKHKTLKNEESNNIINIVNIQNPPRKNKKVIQ